MQKRILITGASGFIGSNLVRQLSKDNLVFALCRKAPTTRSDNERITFLESNILDLDNLVPLFVDIDIVFHCAAYISFSSNDYKKSYEVNVKGTKNVLEAAYRTGVKKVVHLSSCAVLGFSRDSNKVIDENSNLVIEKDNTYAHTKKLAEEVVNKYIQKGLNSSIANIATVYGAGDNKLNSGTIIKLVYGGKMKIVPPGGTSIVSINDLVNGLTLLALKGKSGERYIFCTENMKYKALLERIAKTLGVKAPKYVVPAFSYYPALLVVKIIELIGRLFVKNRVNLITTQILKEVYGYKYFNSSKARQELGWVPSEMFEIAVKEAFDYYKKKNFI